MDDNKQETADIGISTKQTRAIVCLLESKTVGEAAKKAQVGERTLYTWLSDVDFRKALKEAESETINLATRRLMTGQGQALDTLEVLMTKAKHESTRRQAAIDWLNMLLRFREQVDNESRLAELEEIVKDNHHD